MFVALPDCSACRERIQTLMREMNCWEKIEIGYSTDYGTQIWLYCNKEREETDYWEYAKRAKKILRSYHYRLI